MLVEIFSFLSYPFPGDGHPPIGVFYVSSMLITIPMTSILTGLVWDWLTPLFSREGWVRLRALALARILLAGLCSGLLWQISQLPSASDFVVMPLMIGAFLYYPALCFFIVVVLGLAFEMVFGIINLNNKLAPSRELPPYAAALLLIIVAYIISPGYS